MVLLELGILAESSASWFFVTSCEHLDLKILDAYKAEAKRRLDTWLGQLNKGAHRSGSVPP